MAIGDPAAPRITGGVNSLSAREARAARRAAAQAAVRNRRSLVPVGNQGVVGGRPMAAGTLGGRPFMVDSFGNVRYVDDPLLQLGRGGGPLPAAGAPGGPALDVTARPVSQAAQAADNVLMTGNTQPALRAGTPMLNPAQAAGGMADDVVTAAARQATGMPGPSFAPVNFADDAVGAAQQVRAAAGQVLGGNPVANVADDAAAAAARAGTQAANPALSGWRALAARTPSPFVAGASAASPFAAGTLGRAGLYGMGGQLAGGIFDSIVGERDGRTDDMISSALRFGGAGAGIGSMILPGVGTAVGGALGLGVGALVGNATGQDTEATRARNYMNEQLDRTSSQSIVARMDRYGLSQDTQNQILMQLDLLGSTARTEDEARQYVGQVLNELPTLASADLAYQQQQQLQQEEYERQVARAAAIQSWVAPMMRNQLEQFNQSTDASFMLLNNAASRVSDPNIRAVYEANAARMQQSARQAGLGYVAMLGAAPFLNQQQMAAMQPAMTGQGYITGFPMG